MASYPAPAPAPAALSNNAAAAPSSFHQTGGGGGGLSAPSKLSECISNAHSTGFSSLKVLQGGSLVSMRFRLPDVERAPRGRNRRRNKEPRAGLEDILHNQAFISAFIASLSAQILKPFTSSATNKCINWKLLFASGGMPSSHSAAMVAVATAIGLERGLSDSVFGLSAVVAGLTIYDAQGVRRAVGEHAQLINMILLNQPPEGVGSNPEPVVSISASSKMADQELAYANKDCSTPSENESSGFMITQTGLSHARLNRSKTSRIASGTCYSKAGGIGHSSETAKLLEAGERQMWAELETPYGWRPTPLNKSVGHTKLEVGVGALYGLIVALAIHTALQ